MKSTIINSDNILNSLSSILTSTRLEVTEMEDGSFVIRKAGLTHDEKVNLAHSILRHGRRESSEKKVGYSFSHIGNVTVCVMNAKDRYTQIGTSICGPRDRYSKAIGEAIAYERAKYGKVKSTDLL